MKRFRALRRWDIHFPTPIRLFPVVNHLQNVPNTMKLSVCAFGLIAEVWSFSVMVLCVGDSSGCTHGGITAQMMGYPFPEAICV